MRASSLAERSAAWFENGAIRWSVVANFQTRLAVYAGVERAIAVDTFRVGEGVFALQ
jgi:hypothetical protein